VGDHAEDQPQLASLEMSCEQRPAHDLKNIARTGGKKGNLNIFGPGRDFLAGARKRRDAG
jgi:hypothetical protein